MTCAFRSGNYGVYIRDERGVQHHLPHAHIKHRGTVVASVFLVSLDLFDVNEPIPQALLDLIGERHQSLLDLWEELNS